MIDLIVWIAFGALVGWVASLIMNTDGEQGALANIIIGILGAIIGGFVARNFLGSDVNGFNITSFIISLIGAIGLIALLKMFRHRSTI